MKVSKSSPVFPMSSDTKTVMVSGVCWAGAELVEPFILARQCLGVGMIGNNLMFSM